MESGSQKPSGVYAMFGTIILWYIYSQGFIWGQFFLGGGNLHICTYIHTCPAQRKHDVVYSMIFKTTLMNTACISGFLSKL